MQPKALTGKLLELLCKALNIDIKVISVCNHGSLQVERHIKTLSNFLKMNLNQFGTDWVRYVPLLLMHTIRSRPHISDDHSPYQLTFGYPPPGRPAQIGKTRLNSTATRSNCNKKVVSSYQFARVHDETQLRPDCFSSS